MCVIGRDWWLLWLSREWLRVLRVRIHRSLIVLKGNGTWWFGTVLMSIA